jgi:hypothetical protein
MKKIVIMSSLLSIAVISTPVFSGWQDLLKEADTTLKSVTGKDSATIATSTLSNSEVTKGLKEALGIGVEKAIAMLGKENGFLTDNSVKIGLPKNMQKVEQLLRSSGQQKYLDEFINSMNRAAEQAVPEVSNIFVDAIAKMSLTDAQGILSGGDTAATDYFKSHTSEPLSQLITPFVDKAMDSNQVTQYYKLLTDQVKQYDTFGLMKTYLGSAADIDHYVTEQTMDGLFNKIAEQEKLIRNNPTARSTEILQDVFGSIK